MSTTTHPPSYGGWRAKALRHAVLKRDGVKKSERDGYEVHHIIPRSELPVEEWYNPLFCKAITREEHKALHRVENELRSIRSVNDELVKVSLYEAFIRKMGGEI